MLWVLELLQADHKHDDDYDSHYDMMINEDHALSLNDDVVYHIPIVADQVCDSSW